MALTSQCDNTQLWWILVTLKSQLPLSSENCSWSTAVCHLTKKCQGGYTCSVGEEDSQRLTNTRSKSPALDSSGTTLVYNSYSNFPCDQTRFQLKLYSSLPPWYIWFIPAPFLPIFYTCLTSWHVPLENTLFINYIHKNPHLGLCF